MVDTSVEERVLQVIERHMKLKAGTVRLSDRFVEDIGCDSLDCIEQVILMEEQFDVRIYETEHDWDGFTASDAVDLITLIGGE